jgi:hypothetical protein
MVQDEQAFFQRDDKQQYPAHIRSRPFAFYRQKYFTLRNNLEIHTIQQLVAQDSCLPLI